MISPASTADMHIHSFASDSSDTPEQIIAKLIDKDIQLASLTDHNTIDNVNEFLSLAYEKGITAISGVEISSKIGDMVYHILAYGFDPDDTRVSAYVDPILAMMKENNRNLIFRMSDDYDELNVSEYDRYTYERTRGGWEFVNYIYDKGITNNPIEGLAFYNTYGFRLSNCDYPSPGEVIKEVLSWGAHPVLAHPNGYFKDDYPKKESVIDIFDQFTSSGLMGIECYYYSQNEYMTQIALEWCRTNNMMITAGCDSHGTFVPGRDIGSMRIPISKLNLNKLLEGQK